MQELFALLAEYNTQTNQDMLGVLEAQAPELAFAPPALPAFKLQSLKDIVWDSLPAFRPVREGVDELLRRVVRELPPGRYPETLEYRNVRGEAQHKITWRALLHVFNHQTHHRGQVAAPAPVRGAPYGQPLHLKRSGL